MSCTPPLKDRKLVHLVKKIINTDGSNQLNSEEVVAKLRRQHPEYQRKDQILLKEMVAAAIFQIRGETAKTETPASSRKRPTPDQSSVDDETKIRQQEAERERTGIGGDLNASLRNRLIKLQQQENEKSLQEGISEKPKEVDDPASEKRKRRRKVRVHNRISGRSSSDGTDVFDIMPVPRPEERYRDLGGLDDIIQELRQLVEYPLRRPELYRHLGIDPPRGVLLRGPPGTGKSHLANAIAGELGVSYFRLSAPELVSGMSGESEGRIRQLFQTASDMAPSLIFLDEIDVIAPKRNESSGGGSRGMEKRMVAQLLTCMDSVEPSKNQNQAAVVVLGATNRPDALDSALRRAGRFDKEILIGVPDEEARKHIICSLTKGMRLAGDFDYEMLARKTPGYVGADVRSLAKEAAVIAINRIFADDLGGLYRNDETAAFNDERNGSDQLELDRGQGGEVGQTEPFTSEQMEPLFVTMDDFLQALPKVQPSSKREGFATVPDVSWSDIGALQSLRQELAISILEPIRNPEKFRSLGLTIPAGVLLFGPPGCGKTLLAKAIASESGANFISVKGPELLDKYVGESERAVRVVFERARASNPCIVFFDELDSLVPKRGSDASSSGVSERVVNQLLTEMDGLESRRSVFVIAATNRPELIDPAMMRPGRLDKLLYVPLPTPEDRVSILTALSTKTKLGDDVNLEEIGRSSKAEGYSGADCAALLREAGLAVLKESGSDAVDISLSISQKHFDVAFAAVLPSVSAQDQKRYERIRNRMASARIRPISDAQSRDMAAKSDD